MDMGAALAASRDAAFMAGGASFNPTPETVCGRVMGDRGERLTWDLSGSEVG